jgi:hypothetical protein
VSHNVRLFSVTIFFGALKRNSLLARKSISRSIGRHSSWNNQLHSLFIGTHLIEGGGMSCMEIHKYFPSRQAISDHSIGQKLQHKRWILDNVTFLLTHPTSSIINRQHVSRTYWQLLAQKIISENVCLFDLIALQWIFIELNNFWCFYSHSTRQQIIFHLINLIICVSL